MLSLHSMVQLRDLTGDATAFKKRIKAGDGDFPVDCPVEDTTVRIHYRMSPLPRISSATLESALASSASAVEWAFDSRAGALCMFACLREVVAMVPWIGHSTVLVSCCMCSVCVCVPCCSVRHIKHMSHGMCVA